MILDRVTFTGADDSVDPVELLKLSADYPFVEWGILFSQNLQGNPRYPSDHWLREFEKTLTHHVIRPQLSAHLCGKWVRDLTLNAQFSWLDAYSSLATLIARVQVNFHGQWHRLHQDFVHVVADAPLGSAHNLTFILQCDGVNDDAIADLVPLCLPLFDVSGGAGRLPERWPRAWKDVYCGYAGGLGPDNLHQQLPLIAAAAGPERVWIDMERRVRSDDDRTFDLNKVRAVLAYARHCEWFEQQA